MIPALVRTELRGLWRDGRLPAAALFVATLFVAVFMLTGAALRAAAEERATVEAATRAQWDHQGDRHPHRAAHFGLYAFVPDGVLAALDPGVNRAMGRALWLEPHRRNLARGNERLDAPFAGRFDDFHAGFVLVALLPLVLVALAAPSIAGDRERGLLRMLRGVSPSLSAYAWGRFIALFAVVAAVLLPLLVAVAVLAGDGDGWRRTALLAAAALAYATTFIALALGVSIHARGARSALAIGVAAWIVLVFVVPRIGVAHAAGSIELPTRDAFWAAIRHDIEHGLPGDGDAATRAARFDAALLARHGVDRLEALPVGGHALRRLQRDAYADRVHALHFERLWQAYAAQEARVGAAALLSPALSMQRIVQALAGTDLAHRRHFEEAAEAYRQQVNTLIDEWDAANTRGLTSFDDAYAGNALWQSIPPFHYVAPDAGFALAHAAGDLLRLLGWLLASLAVLALSARRLR